MTASAPHTKCSGGPQTPTQRHSVLSTPRAPRKKTVSSMRSDLVIRALIYPRRLPSLNKDGQPVNGDQSRIPAPPKFILDQRPFLGSRSVNNNKVKPLLSDGPTMSIVDIFGPVGVAPRKRQAYEDGRMNAVLKRGKEGVRGGGSVDREVRPVMSLKYMCHQCGEVGSEKLSACPGCWHELCEAKCFKFGY